jgi:hypothetical protein
MASHNRSEAIFMSGSLSCPQCGNVLFTIELPISSAVQAKDVSPPHAPLLLRVPEAARLLGVSRSAMYSLAATGDNLREVPSEGEEVTDPEVHDPIAASAAGRSRS